MVCMHDIICPCCDTGKITADELVQYFGMSYEQAYMEISLVDSDKDGAVCLPEYMQMRDEGDDFNKIGAE